MNPLRLIILMTILFSPLAHSGEVTTVTLHSTVRITEPGECTLSMIAKIVGPQTQELQGLKIGIPVPTGPWTQIQAEQIRELLQNTPRIRAGSVVVQGVETHITRRISLDLGETGQSNQVQRQAKQPSPPTLHDQLKFWLSKRFGVDKNAIRVQLSQADADRLAQSAEGRMVEISQIGTSSRLALRLTIYNGERVESSFTINARVEIQRDALVVIRDVGRTEILDESMISMETQWFSPFVTPASPEKAIGLACRSRLRAGTVVYADDVQSPMVIQRGEIVSARSISGTVVVNLRARALSNVRDGELFELESIDGKSKFTARASGPGRAVIVNKDTTKNEGASR